ncbi:EamA family transporter [uncultured Vibrio sp.]|uniref:EamA family transporter n=1 Tax=uncultured Vibrio sp. TaxID=114054 RepID=UPI0025FB044B|nr:EamA family transporter [uncultured Vibrio sp.]
MEQGQSTQRTVLSVFAVLLAIASITAGASFAKSIFATLGPESVTVFRLSISALILFFGLQVWKVRLKRSDLGITVLYGVAIAGMNLFLYKAIESIPIGIALGIQLTGPLVVSVIFSRNRLDFIWVVLAALGIFLLIPSVNGVASLDYLGVIYALVAGAFWGGYIIAGKKAGNRFGHKAPALGLIVSSIVILPIGIEYVSFVDIGPQLIGIIVAIALLSSAVPLMLEMVALRNLPTKTYGVLTSGEPASGAILGFLILGEQLTTNQLVGIVTIMIASVGVVISPSPHRDAPIAS